MSITETVTTAARNAWALSFGSGIEAPEPAPATVLFDEPHRQLRRYHAAGETSAPGDAVLLVPPLGAPATCFDLRPDQSLVRHLLDTGRAPYLVDYGEIGFADRAMGFEHWIDDILPEAIRRVSADRGGAPVDLIGWSIGGTLSLLTAAAHSDLPIRSITAVGAPLDYDHMIGMPQLRAAAKLTGGRATTTAVRLAGGVPAPLVRVGYRLTALDREIRRPFFVANNLARTETLARMESIDRFQASMPGYPGRFYGQVWGRLILANDLGNGGLRLGDRWIGLDRISVPVLLFGGTTDVITTAASARAGLRTISNAPVQYELVPGSHLGILTGPDARDTTWTHLNKFLDELR